LIKTALSLLWQGNIVNYSIRFTIFEPFILTCLLLDGCPDFPEELSKLSLIEHPSPLYFERKADLWRHINDTELEDADCDSGYCSAYHNQLNLLPAVNPGYLPVITNAGSLVFLPYGYSQDNVPSSTVKPHNDSVMGSQASWHYRKSSAVSAADKSVSLTPNHACSAGTHMSRQSSLNSKQHSTATVMSSTDHTTVQNVSLFLLFVHIT